MAVVANPSVLSSPAARRLRIRYYSRGALTGMLGLLLLAALHTRGHWLIAEWLPLIIFPAIAALLLLKAEREWTASAPAIAARHLPLLSGMAILVLLLFSSATRHKWFFYLGWDPGGAPFARTALGRFLLLTTLLMPLLRRSDRLTRLLPPAALLAGQLLCAAALWIGTDGGRPLWRDDHPSFIFRLHELVRIFPQLESYNPYWNGGGVHSVGVTSGIAGPFLLAFPLWLTRPIHEVYTAGIIWIFIFAVPWLLAGAVYAAFRSAAAAAFAGILALGVSQHFFLWMLHFGTIGATLASSMLPVLMTLTWRSLYHNRTRWPSALGCALAAFFLMLWPPATLYAAALPVSWLLERRRWSWAKWRFLLACGLLAALFFSPWARSILGHASGTVDYVMDGTPRPTAQPIDPWNVVRKGAEHLKYHVLEGQPLLIVFGLLGILTVAPSPLRRWFLPTMLMLVFLTGWGPTLMPRLQLGRTAIPLFFAATPPAALFLARIWGARDPRLAPARAVIAALLLLSVWNVAKIYRGRGGLTPYTSYGEQVARLTEWIRTNVPAGTRVMFTGRTVHAYGRGHVAYLPVLTGREMMACDYYHFPTDMVEYEFPPRPWRESLKGILAFCDLYNVNGILTYHDSWKSFFRAHPEWFDEGLQLDAISGFVVRRDSAPLRGARGRIEATFNRLTVELEEPADEVTLPYHWVEGLYSPEGVRLVPVDEGSGALFIRAKPGPRRTFTIRWQSPGPFRRSRR